MSFGHVSRPLRVPRKLRKILLERLTEPLHLNLLSLFVWLFGSLRAKVNFDLVVRQQYAFGILNAADRAVKHGIPRVTIIEFGVASGAGLLNMCKIAERTRRATGVEFEVVGFDTGTGLPPPLDYRDRPEVYRQGEFHMDVATLKRTLPPYAKLILGDIADTVPDFLAKVSPGAPIAFVAIDVDYYSSTKSCLKILQGEPEKYLPLVVVYLDDIGGDGCSPWTGELLAVEEFNAEKGVRKIAPYTMLRWKRIFKNPLWIDRTFVAHIHDHPRRSVAWARAA